MNIHPAATQPHSPRNSPPPCWFSGDNEEMSVCPDNAKERTETGDGAAEASNEIYCAQRRTDSYPNWAYDELMPIEKWPEIRNQYKSSSIVQNEKYLRNPSVEKFDMGLGWNRGANRDPSVALLDENLKPLDVVRYRQPSSKCGGVKYAERRAESAAGTDNCVISVTVARIPADVHHMLFCVSNYNHSIASNDETSGYIRMMNADLEYRGREMFIYSIPDMSSQSTVMGVWTRKGPLWSFKALGRPAIGGTIEQLLENDANLECLADCQSWKAEQRKVTVTVVKGRGLAAKDRPTLWNKATSDPYYTIKFKDKSYKSEHIPKTLDPEWKSVSFELGCITEAETAPLKIQIFDYDCVSRDDFMGERWIPGCALYDLGTGHHTYWFLLNHTKEGPYAKEDVSGDILISIVVDEA